MNSILVIGDTHITESREKAISVGMNEIYKNTKKKKFDHVVLLGDIFDRNPSIAERIYFANFINILKEHTRNVHVIRGTGWHAYTKGLYHLDDLGALGIIKIHDILEIDKYVFGHFEVKGFKCSNGYTPPKTEHKIEKHKIYIIGHLHTPMEKDNVYYVGSLYKTDFYQKDEQKRILIIENNEFNFISIPSRPMYEIELLGRGGKVQVKMDKEMLHKRELDLKIKVNTDNLSIAAIHLSIAKIKAKFGIEYYQQEINIKEIKIDTPKNLDRNKLLEKYCKIKDVNFELVQKELTKQ